MNILIFSGTSDGNELIENLLSKEDDILKYNIFVSVATEYGKNLVLNRDIEILSGRLNLDEIIDTIKKHQIEYVIDATHPYAVEVSKNISEACKKSEGVKLLRLLREQSLYEEHITLVDDIKSACELALEGNVLATTGSKQINEYIDLHDYKNRLYARVLPTDESVLLCENIGLNNEHIITSLGALSVEENIVTIKQYNIKSMITKDGGIKGGFPQKSEACKLTDTTLYVIKRPIENGLSKDEILLELR